MQQRKIQPLMAPEINRVFGARSKTRAEKHPPVCGARSETHIEVKTYRHGVGRKRALFGVGDFIHRPTIIASLVKLTKIILFDFFFSLLNHRKWFSIVPSLSSPFHNMTECHSKFQYQVSDSWAWLFPWSQLFVVAYMRAKSDRKVNSSVQ